MPDELDILNPYADPPGWAEFVEEPGAAPPELEPPVYFDALPGEEPGAVPEQFVTPDDGTQLEFTPEEAAEGMTHQEFTPEEATADEVGWAQLVGATQDAGGALPGLVQAGVGAVSGALPSQPEVAAAQTQAEGDVGYRALGDFEPPQTLMEASELRIRQEHAAQVARDKAFIKATGELNLARAEAERQMKDLHLNYQRRAAQLDREYQELANKAPDPGRWWANASTSQKLGAAMAAVFGGMLQGFQGGPNRGLETVFKYIEQDIDSQRDAMFSQRESLQARRSLLGEEFEKTGDLVRSSWSMKLAALAHMDQELSARQRLYDPEGSLNAKIGMNRQEIMLKGREWIQKANKDLLDDQVKVAELQLKELDARTRAAELALKASKGTGKGKTAKAFEYGPEVDPLHMTGVWHVNPDGSRTAVRAKDKEAAHKFSELAMPTRVILDLFPDLHQMRDQANAEGLPGELNLKGFGSPLGHRMRSAHATLFTELRRVAGTGANLTEQEIKEIWKEAGKDATTWAETKHLWEETERRLRRKINEHARDASGDETVIFDMAVQPRAQEGIGGSGAVAKRAAAEKRAAKERIRHKELSGAGEPYSITYPPERQPTDVAGAVERVVSDIQYPQDEAEFEAYDREERARQRGRKKKRDR